MKFILVVFAALLPAVAYSIGESGDSDWPKGARIEVELRLSAAVGTNGQLKVSGDLFIKNPSAVPLTIQSPHNRLVLAFLVFDPLGNPVAPKGLAKVDPAFLTHSLSGRSTYTHHFQSLDFITGSMLFGYELSSGKSYKILAVYRPAGPHGPGFTSQETSLEIPNLGRFKGDSYSPASPSKAVVAWREPVEGVSVRLRADKTRWTTNETPTFGLDVRNQGQREFHTFQSQETGRLEVDGVWYVRAEDYHLAQTQLRDALAPDVPLESLTVYVLILPDSSPAVFRRFDSKPMEEAIGNLPRGSVLHYDGNALMARPPEAQMQALMAYCKEKGISFIESPTR